MKQTANKFTISINPFLFIFLLYTIYMIYFSFTHGRDYGFFCGISCFFGFFITYLAGGRIVTNNKDAYVFTCNLLIGFVMVVIGYFLLNFSKAKLGLLSNLDTQFSIIVWIIVNVVFGILANKKINFIKEIKILNNKIT